TARPVAASARPTAPATSFSRETKTMSTKTMSGVDLAAAAAAAPLSRRPRRLRRTESIRALVRETVVRPEDLIYPLFVVPNSRPKVEIGSMPGVWQLRVREIVEEASKAYDAGIRAILLF